MVKPFQRPGSASRVAPFRWLILLVPTLLVVIVIIGGCAEIDYYAQAIHGHLRLMRDRQPVQQLLDAADTPDALRQQLKLSAALLQFAHARLQLPDNGSYRSYIHTDSRYVVWNVYAAPALSLDAMQWCVPLVVGCSVYRGWFDATRASQQAQQLQQQGYDTFIGGVTAYSTLGWFSDPLLSSFFSRGEWHTAALLFHELAHQQLYIAGDSAFNESFATSVEREATRRWLQRHGSAEPLAQARHHWRDQDQRARLFDAARQRLHAIYQSSNSAVEQQQAKQAIFAQLRADTGWGESAQYPLNNATLAAMAAYTNWVPAFQQLLRQQHGDLTAFYRTAEQLGALPDAQRQQQLQALSAAAQGDTAF